ncbi:hypothetical protein POSPLADRAFT_1160806 [Postia placenta MAD-698-R-SB12]|uniref:Carboxylesterase type B domain-containing protein n=1 Tax=Postia placenta MAD-698-R-SB12 TaxID=670580 RepID=A0A1X6MIW0_9APHY|nr:hypothetical protein POSPLADRAFT_1160806 [Postia placenta MAD-698-R-SB12]OSX56176.1 hypothetical protein POSPLADRAFT_1160806 [Postia placenta MAD-698-R-SB12]
MNLVKRVAYSNADFMDTTEPMVVDWDGAHEARPEPMQVDNIGTFECDGSMDWSPQDNTTNDGCTAAKGNIDAVLAPCTAIMNIVGLPSHEYSLAADAAKEGFASCWFERAMAGVTPDAAGQTMLSGDTLMDLMTENMLQLDFGMAQMNDDAPEPMDTTDPRRSEKGTQDGACHNLWMVLAPFIFEHADIVTSFICFACIAHGVHALPSYSNNASGPSGPIVDVGYAAFLGNDSIPGFPGIEFFGGIRYVQPPLGELRFRAPQLLDETVGPHNVTDARDWGDICMQEPAQVGFGSEDCLTLNVWRSAGTQAGDNVPVALYIHSAQGFPMSSWVNETGGAMVGVNIQYRLGMFGFLASAAVQEDGDMNAGLLDQRAAFDWVRRHISSFGGDPGRITVSGQSAGSADIVHQMVSYGGQGEPPFQAAIAQSIGMDPLPIPEEYEHCFANVSASVGCLSPTNTSQSIMSCLRAAPLSALVTAINSRPSSCGFLPVVDGMLLPALPSQLIATGRFHRMPFIGGHVTDDGSIFVGDPANFVNTTDGFVASIMKRYTLLSNTTIARMIELYPLSDFPSQWERAKRAFGDTVFTCIQLALNRDWVIAQKLMSEGRTDAYNYRFNTPDPVQLAANPWEGVMHTSELFFLFQGASSGPSPTTPVALFAPFNASEKVLATETIGYWTSFSRAFSPNTFKPLGSSPEWLTAESGRLVIEEGGVNGTASYMEERSQAYEERCAFWMEVGTETRIREDMSRKRTRHRHFDAVALTMDSRDSGHILSSTPPRISERGSYSRTFCTWKVKLSTSVDKHGAVVLGLDKAQKIEPRFTESMETLVRIAHE